MSEFLMIVPEGWQELTDAQAFVDQHGEAQLLDLLAQGNIASVEAMIQDAGIVPLDQAIPDVRMFRDGGQFRIWFKLG